MIIELADVYADGASGWYLHKNDGNIEITAAVDRFLIKQGMQLNAVWHGIRLSIYLMVCVRSRYNESVYDRGKPLDWFVLFQQQCAYQKSMLATYDLLALELENEILADLIQRGISL